jgi:hypothetical protein
VTIDEAQRRKTLARWHRRLALAVGLWLVLLALSGILINHAHDWGLDRRPLPGPLLALLYGIETASTDHCELAEAIGPRCYEVFARFDLPAGALLVSATELFLLDEQGLVIETLGASHLGLSVVESSLRQGDVLFFSDGQSIVRTDLHLLNFEMVGAETARALSGSAWLQNSAGASRITWERLLLDVHAARFLGPVARWFNDLMAVLILVLAGSGAWLYRAKRSR